MSDSPPQTSYSQILKSTSIIGSAQVVNLVLSIVRVKFAAVLIGPVGVGLIGNFQAIQGVVGTVAGMGLQSSGVREIALKADMDDKDALSRTIQTLQRIGWFSGLIGAFVMVLLSPLFSKWTFGSDEYTVPIAMIGLTIIFANMAGIQQATIQGLRRIGDLARIQVVSGFVGTFSTIALYLLYGLNGILPSLILLALMQCAVSYFYMRQVVPAKVSVSWKETIITASPLVRLGMVFMLTTLINVLVLYIARALITQQVGLAGLGIFSAANALSTMFINLVLVAMASDYYPRLTSAVPDRLAVNRLVNEQIEIGILLALPGLLATIALAPWVIRTLYTSEFLPAADLLQWFMLGCLGRVIAWPLEYVMVALGRARLYFFTMLGFNLLHLLMVVIGLFNFGIEGVAAAYSCVYLITIPVLWVITQKLTNFSWSRDLVRLTFFFLVPFTATSFSLVHTFSLWPATLLGLAITVVASIVSARVLVVRIGQDHRIVLRICQFPGMRWILGIKVFQ
jgi:enterobacterial common antigen flippase